MLPLSGHKQPSISPVADNTSNIPCLLDEAEQCLATDPEKTLEILRKLPATTDLKSDIQQSRANDLYWEARLHIHLKSDDLCRAKDRCLELLSRTSLAPLVRLRVTNCLTLVEQKLIEKSLQKVESELQKNLKITEILDARVTCLAHLPSEYMTDDCQALTTKLLEETERRIAVALDKENTQYKRSSNDPKEFYEIYRSIAIYRKVLAHSSLSIDTHSKAKQILYLAEKRMLDVIKYERENRLEDWGFRLDELHKICLQVSADHPNSDEIRQSVLQIKTPVNIELLEQADNLFQNGIWDVDDTLQRCQKISDEAFGVEEIQKMAKELIVKVEAAKKDFLRASSSTGVS